MSPPPPPPPNRRTSSNQRTKNSMEYIHSPERPPEDTARALAAELSEVEGLPALEYNLKECKTKLSIVTGLLVIESSLLPIALYYGLTFGTTLRSGITFAIITSFYGFVTGIEFGLRSLRLILVDDRFRPLGGKRWHFDFTHHTLSIGYFYMTAILIGASIPHPPFVKPLAMPVALFFVQIAVQLLVTGYMDAHNMPAPFRISSVPKGARMPPLVLTIIEDIVGVDGSGTKDYRRRLMARYAVSPRFRRMIKNQNWFWGAGALFTGVGTIIAVALTPDVVAYGLGWGIPLIFVIIWSNIAVLWIQRELRIEKEMWAVKPGAPA